MGFFGRLGKVATGLGGGFWAPLGLVKDLGGAAIGIDPDKNDPDNGFFHTLVSRSAVRGARTITALMGPEEGLGAAIGGLPEAVRAPSRSVIKPTLDAFDWAGREIVREPLSTLMTMGSLTDSQTYGGGGGLFFRGDAWRDAYKIAQKRSIGQSVALAFMTKDILDPDEVNEAMHTDMFNAISGTTDAVVQFFGDPTVLGGKFAKVAKSGRIAEALEHAGAGEGLVKAANKLRAGDYILRSAAEDTKLARAAKRAERAEERAADLGKAAEQKANDFMLSGPKAAVSRALSNFSAKLETSTIGRNAEAKYANLQKQALLREGERRERYFRDGFFEPVKAEIGRSYDELAAQAPDGVVNLDRHISQIRDRIPQLRDAAHGADVAYGLAMAGKNDAQLNRVMRFFMGDGTVLDDIADEHKAVSAWLKEYAHEHGSVRTTTNSFDDNLAHFTRSHSVDGIADTQAIVADQRSYLRSLDRLLGNTEEGNHLHGVLTRSGSSGGVGAAPTLGRLGRARNDIVRSTLYQSHPLSKPIRVFFDMRPHRSFGVHDPQSDVQIDRLARDAGLSLPEREALRGEWIRSNANERGELYNRAIEDKLYQRFSDDYGLSATDLEQVRLAANKGRSTAAKAEDAFASGGRDLVPVLNDEGEIIRYRPEPMSPTQLQNKITAPDFQLLRHEARRLGHAKMRMFAKGQGDLPLHRFDDAILKTNAKFLRGVDAPVALLNGVMSVWRPAVLLRPAWPIRIVLEGQGRIIAKNHALLDMLVQGPRNLRNLAIDVSGQVGKGGGVIGGGVAGFAMGGPLGAIAGSIAGNKLIGNLAELEKHGLRQGMNNGYKIAHAYGEGGKVFRDLAGGRGDMAKLGKIENQYLEKYRQHFRPAISPGETTHIDNWLDVLNHQMGNDEIARRFASGQSRHEIAEWLRSDADDARIYREASPERATNPEQWVNDWTDVIHDYTVGSDPEILKRLASGQEISKERLEAIAVSDRPVVHGNIVEQAQGRGPIQQAVHDLVEKIFHVLGGLPEDDLNRLPFAEEAYNRHMRGLLSNLTHRRYTEAEVTKLQNTARNLALRDTKALLYDFAERSDFASMVRMIMPFFPAYQEVLTRWTGLSLENPEFLARARLVFNSPDKAGLVHKDDQGNEYIAMRIPTWAKGLIGVGPLKGALDDQGTIKFNKKGFNMIMQGGPGLGPVVNLAAGQIIKAKPEMEETLSFMLPYGPPGGVLDNFLPSSAKRAFSGAQGEDNRSFRNSYYRILQTRLIDMELGKRPMIDMDDPNARADFLEEVKTETKRFFHLRTFASLVSPVAPSFDSPYQTYIDEYRKLKAENPMTADQKFLDEHGDEYFAITQAFTKLNDGVPATFEGEEARSRHKALIQRYPELGGLIIGEEGGGSAAKFSRALYDKQLSDPVRAGSGKARRSPLTPEEFVLAPDVRLGWQKFSNFMDLIDAVRIERKLPNLQVKAAKDLAEAKRQYVYKLADEHPAWYADYETQDPGKAVRKVQGLRAIAADKSMAGRQDVQGLQDYLHYRDLISAALTERRLAGQASSLSAAANSDLAEAWETLTSRIIEGNNAFADTYHRYLDRDPVDNPKTFTKELETLAKQASMLSTSKKTRLA